jgi:hypothetical protein
MYLNEELALLELQLEYKKKELTEEMERSYYEYEDKRDKLFQSSGVIRCPKCQGFGKLERLDSGYMRKFGLREWDGCKTCGSTKPEEVGRGYILKVENKET